MVITVKMGVFCNPICNPICNPNQKNTDFGGIFGLKNNRGDSERFMQ